MTPRFETLKLAAEVEIDLAPLEALFDGPADTLLSELERVGLSLTGEGVLQLAEGSHVTTAGGALDATEVGSRGLDLEVLAPALRALGCQLSITLLDGHGKTPLLSKPEIARVCETGVTQ